MGTINSMKEKLRFINYLILLSMVLFTVKPVLSHLIENQIQQKAQYSATSSPCSSRTAVVSSCASSWLYTVAEDEYGVEAYLFLLAGLLYYSVVNFTYNSPIFSLFKPPILF
jgi:hypothetical protein